MSEKLALEAEDKIRKFCREIAVSRKLNADIEEELYGHLEDKALAYLNGDESLTSEDIVLLVREHFGDQENLKAMLGEIHSGGKWRLSDELTSCSFGGNADDFWGVLIFPWKKANRLLYGIYVFAGVEILVIAILASINIINLLKGGDYSIPLYFWVGFTFLALGLGTLFYVTYMIVGKKVEAKKSGLRKSAEMQADCMFVHGALESPAIAQIYDGKLILTPLVSDQVVVPLDQIEKVEECHWYNGSQYWGDNAYFKLSVRDKENRIGFAVSRPNPWRRALNVGGEIVVD